MGQNDCWYSNRTDWDYHVTLSNSPDQRHKKLNFKRITISLLSKIEIGKRIASDQRSKLLLSSSISLGCSFLYALYQGILGAFQVSLWFFAMCAFYSILAVIRFCAIVCGWRVRNDDSSVSEYFVMKVSGILLLLLGVVVAWINFISLSQNMATAYDKITMITISTYTFYKMTVVTIKAIRQRKNFFPLLVVLRNISYAEVSASVLTLQRSMLISFGSMEKDQICIMNTFTGAAVCLFILALGIFMIIKSRKEHHYGKIKTHKSERKDCGKDYLYL